LGPKTPRGREPLGARPLRSDLDLRF
jgi:hypothetical protein